MATILTPSEHCGAVMQLCTARRGQQLEYAFIGTQPHSVATRHSSGSASTTLSGSSSGSSTSAGSSSSTGGAATASIGDRALLRYQLPLSELAGDFYSKLKSVTHG
jgi:translation elongation factor EF-4